MQIKDPRDDKTTDHKHWQDLLWNCWNMDKPLYYLLHGIRCGGAEVMETNESFKLLPGEWSETEWEEIKQVKLDPFRDKLVDVFKITRVGHYFDGKIPDQFNVNQNNNSLKYAWIKG